MNIFIRNKGTFSSWNKFIVSICKNIKKEIITLLTTGLETTFWVTKHLFKSRTWWRKFSRSSKTFESTKSRWKQTSWSAESNWKHTQARKIGFCLVWQQALWLIYVYTQVTLRSGTHTWTYKKCSTFMEQVVYLYLANAPSGYWLTIFTRTSRRVNCTVK